jgi:hypothetical protein
MVDAVHIDLERVTGHAQFPLDKSALLERARRSTVDASGLALLARLAANRFATYTELSAALDAESRRGGARAAGRPSPDAAAFPSLGNGVEASLEDRSTGGWGRSEGPESQGGYAGEEYGGTAQGAYGDESYDPGYQQEKDAVEAIDPDAGLSVLADLPSDHEGPGRGEGGGEWSGQVPLESPEEVVRRGVFGALGERQRDDDAIADDARDVLATSTEIRGDIAGVVERGEVTLTGIVPDDESRRAACRKVAEIPGVTGIVDRLRVQSV